MPLERSSIAPLSPDRGSHGSRLFNPASLLTTALALSASFLAIPSSGAAEPSPTLRAALTFHASFDRHADADFSRGDARVYTALDRNKRDEARPGLPETDAVRLVANEGRFAGALQFRQKIKPQIFYRGGDNLGFKARDWSGSFSCWLRLDPDKDLEPGYCDPIQLVGPAWTDGNMFVEFSKDHTPRHFRFAILAVTKFWNPNNRKWEEIPDAERPMVPVYAPPFRRERWTHVLCTFAQINSGNRDGRGTLYLDGVKQGSFNNWNHTFHWDAAKSALTVGLAYVGYLDDLAVFDRELTEAEAHAVFLLPHGISSLRPLRP